MGLFLRWNDCPFASASGIILATASLRESSASCRRIFCCLVALRHQLVGRLSQLEHRGTMTQPLTSQTSTSAITSLLYPAQGATQTSWTTLTDWLWVAIQHVEVNDVYACQWRVFQKWWKHKTSTASQTSVALKHLSLHQAFMFDHQKLSGVPIAVHEVAVCIERSTSSHGHWSWGLWSEIPEQAMEVFRGKYTVVTFHSHWVLEGDFDRNHFIDHTGSSNCSTILSACAWITWQFLSSTQVLPKLQVPLDSWPQRLHGCWDIFSACWVDDSGGLGSGMITLTTFTWHVANIALMLCCVVFCSTCNTCTCPRPCTEAEIRRKECWPCDVETCWKEEYRITE